MVNIPTMLITAIVPGNAEIKYFIAHLPCYYNDKSEKKQSVIYNHSNTGLSGKMYLLFYAASFADDVFRYVDQVS